MAVDAADLTDLVNNSQYPALGFFCRINSQNGFDKLVDAFIDLKRKNVLPGLTLHVSGGFTGDDKSFISKQIKKIKSNGFSEFLKIYPEFQGNGKHEFFSNIDIMSVPVRKHDGYGLYILEANSAGIPVVQPATGGYPEILEKTKGGITYSPDTVDELSLNLLKLFKDDNLRKQLGKNGRENVNKELSLNKMSDGLSEVYTGVISK